MGEIHHGVACEAATTLEDIVYRRTRAAWFSDGAAQLVPAIARLAAPLLGWDADETERQVEHVSSLLAAELAFKES